MNAEMICMFVGLFISGLVSLFKKLPFVEKYPKVVAFVLSVITGGAALFFENNSSSFDWLQLLNCVLGPFAVSVATYEVAKTPLLNKGK